MVLVEITRWPTPTRGPLGRVTEVLGDIDEPGVDTEIIIRKYGIPDEHSAEAVAEAGSSAARSRKGHQGAHRLPSAHDGHDRRRARARLRRRDHARAAAERQLLARRAHRRRRALRARRAARSTRKRTSAATSVYFPERAVHMFPAELSTGLCSLQSAGRSPGAVVPDGDRPQGHRRALRAARRRHQQQRADDLHRRQRDPHRSTIRRSIGPLRGARAAVRDDARAVRDPEQAPPPPRLDRLRPEGAGDRPRRRRAWSRRSSRSSATSRTA